MYNWESVFGCSPFTFAGQSVWIVLLLYIRRRQIIDRQLRNIKAEYPSAYIVQEAYTGTSIFRPEWLKLYRVLKAGDTVVFDSVSRMSRNAEEGFALY